MDFLIEPDGRFHGSIDALSDGGKWRTGIPQQHCFAAVKLGATEYVANVEALPLGKGGQRLGADHVEEGGGFLGQRIVGRPGCCQLVKAIFRSPFANELLAPLVAVGLQEGCAAFSGTGLSDDRAAYHFVSTMISLRKWWLDHDQPCSAEELANASNQLLIRPLV